MEDFKQSAQFGTATGVRIDQGLRAYMLGIYNYMATALVVTAIAALTIANMATTSDPSQAVGTFGNGILLTATGAAIYASPLQFVIIFAPLVFVLVMSFGINRLSKSAATTLFYLFSVVMGISLSSIFLVYTGESIVQTFFVTAAAFAGLSLYGYTTKRDLSAFGTFLVIGLFGLIIASLVNLFMQSGAMAFVINVAGVGIFAGLTAWDTQRLKDTYRYVAGNSVAEAKSSILGALNLYLNFINLFMFLLQFLGNRR